MLITIGLCVKNCANTISETLRCILNQDYPPELIEVLVVDDGGSDETLPKIISLLSSSSLDFKVLSTGGKGLGFARQLVVKNATGKYILWIDGDMLLPKDYIRRQVEFMERNPTVAKARAKWGILSEKSLPAKLESFRLLSSSKNKKSSHLVGIGGSICRTDTIRAIGGIDENIRGAGEDIDLAIRLNSSWRSAISNAVFYHRFRETWKGLWQQYYWYGYGMHYINSKHKGVIHIWKYLPHVASFVGLLQALNVFRLTKLKIAFLLPIQYIFKYSAWINGYLRSHLDRYEYRSHNWKV